jgi:hypothetical protein
MALMRDEVDTNRILVGLFRSRKDKMRKATAVARFVSQGERQT